MPALDDLRMPLVDEPVAAIVDWVVREDSALAATVEAPHRIAAFRTLASIRVGILLGQLLFDEDLRDADDSESWIDALLHDSAHRQAIEREVRAVAAEIAADPDYADEQARVCAHEQLGHRA